MNDPLLVGLLERLDDLTGNRGGLRLGKTPCRDHLRHRPARDVFHDQEVHVLLAVEIVDRGDVGVVQAR